MRTLMVGLVSLTAISCTETLPETRADVTDNAAPITFDDPDVTRIYQRMRAAMDPDGQWDRTRYLAFDWIVARAEGEPVVRSHRWDRWEGEYRVETSLGDQFMLALFNTNNPGAGRVWMNGDLVEGDSAQTLLARANGMHINDSYWLIMPYKWADPGVNTRYLGERTDDDGRAWEVVELSFEEVGLTPQNRYHAFVDVDSGLMERWHHFRTADADPSPAEWLDWTSFGGIRLAMDHALSNDARLYFENVEVAEEIPAGAFDPPVALASP